MYMFYLFVYIAIFTKSIIYYVCENSDQSVTLLAGHRHYIVNSFEYFFWIVNIDSWIVRVYSDFELSFWVVIASTIPVNMHAII